jgi:hypothetical protein
VKQVATGAVGYSDRRHELRRVREGLSAGKACANGSRDAATPDALLRAPPATSPLTVRCIQGPSDKTASRLPSRAEVTAAGKSSRPRPRTAPTMRTESLWTMSKMARRRPTVTDPRTPYRQPATTLSEASLWANATRSTGVIADRDGSGIGRASEDRGDARVKDCDGVLLDEAGAGDQRSRG